MPRKPSCRPRTANSRSPSRFSRSSHSPVSAWMPASRQASSTRLRRYSVSKPSGRPLVADRAGDVGVLGRRADHRADPRRARARSRRQFWMACTVSTGTMYSRPVDAVALLEVVQQRVVLQHVGGLLDLRGEDAGQPGHDHRLEVAAGEPGRERIDADEQAHLGVGLRGRRRSNRPPIAARSGLLRRRDGVLQVEHDAVRAGAMALSTQAGGGRGRRGSSGMRCISSSSAARARARRSSSAPSPG